MRVSNVVVLICFMVVSECIAYYYPPVFWHYQNCVFRKLRESFGNETKEYFMKVLPHQQVRIVCPSSAAINDWVGQRISKRFQNFYLVDKNGYDNCKVNDDVNPSENKLLLLCDDFKQVRYRTFKFYPGSNLNEPRFIPGRHYYFIGTGNGDRQSLKSKSGGHCKEYHMRLHIYVCNPKKETCIWEQPYCEPTYEVQRAMIRYSRKLPPPTEGIATVPTIKTAPMSITKKSNVEHFEGSMSSTEHSHTPTKENPLAETLVNNNKDCKYSDEDGDSVHMVLNFVLGGVILFMAVVIFILSFGLARKSDSARPSSGAFSVISAQEPNANLYQESARFVKPVYSPVSKSPPQTPISINPPLYLAPMAEIRPRSASNRNGYNNAVYGQRQDSVEVPAEQVDTTSLLHEQQANTAEPV